MNSYAIPGQLSEPFTISTLVGKSIHEEGVYCDCPIFLNRETTMDDIIELDMVQFEFILGME